MTGMYQYLRIFIASPNDVSKERETAEAVISNVSMSCRDALGLHVDVHTWKHLPPITRLPEKTIQERINEELESCDVFVLILYKRYGAIEPGHTKSNTEREIELALNLLSNGRKLMFLSYFRDIAPNADAGDQEKKVRELREKLAQTGNVWYRAYSTPADFKDRFTHDLYRAILDWRLSSSKQRALMQFWQFGIPEGSTHPRLAIMYPPLDRQFMVHSRPDTVWLKRLVPHVVFEDFKALQKIEKTLRLAGFRDFNSFNVVAPPPDVEDLNRVWLCLPRSPLAQRQLALYNRRAQFRFAAKQGEQETAIYWWRSGHIKDDPTIIQSPLSKYLELQRRDISGGNWQPEHGRVVAKDFAILARFSDTRERLPMSYGKLKDYFIAGIRGLGTWGVGWFIDRRYHAIEKLCKVDDRDLQLLLEVIYRNEHVIDVRPVSHEPESYFQNENNIDTIQAVIKQYAP